MSVERLIDELQERGLLSDRLMTKLRETIAESERPLSAKALARFLVTKNHLTKIQSTDVLNGLLLKGVDVEAVSIPQVAIDEPSQDSSIFGSHIIHFPPPQRPEPEEEGDDDEYRLAPIDDDADVPSKGSKDISSEEDVPVLRPLKIEEEDGLRLEPMPEVASAKIIEEPIVRNPRLAHEISEPEQLDDVRAAPGGKKKPKKKVKPTKDKKQWDSPLILIGGGGLVLLLLCGVTLWWLLNWETGDQKLAQARSAMESGAYAQAIEHYVDFVTTSPRHPEHSVARVQLALVRVRQPTEAGDFSAALDAVQKEVPAVEEEEEFDEAHGELAALLPQIAQGLASQAESAKPGDDVKKLTDQATKALALCDNLAYIPKTLRDEGKFSKVRETLERVERRQQSLAALAEGLKAMQQAVTDGKPIASYTAHLQLLRDHPELTGDVSLAEMIQKTTAAEQAGIKFVSEEHPAATTELPVPWVASLALAHHRVKPAAAVPGVDGTAVVRVDGALYGLEAATGRLLWRRYVGFAIKPWPISVERDLIIADTARNDLLRLDAATGKLKWRQELGEPFADPLIVGERAFIPAKSGRLLVVDLKSGMRAGYLQFAQPLSVTPAVDRTQERLYLPGERASLYSIALKDLSCLGVFYLGHSAGAITEAPAVIVDKLAVIENDGAETSNLRLLVLDEKGAISKKLLERRLTGLPVEPPMPAGRRLMVVTDRGQIDVYDVNAGSGDNALTPAATRDASGAQPLVRYVAVTGRNIWIADYQLSKYSIVPTGNRLPVEEIENNFAGSTFDHPLAVFGDTLVHVRRPKGRAGAIVAATETAHGRTLWETDLALPPAGSPVVDAASKTIAMATAEGYLFRFDEAAIRSRVQDTPLAAELMPAELPALAASVDLGQGRAAFSAPGSDRLLLYTSAQGNSAARWITLESPLASAVAPLGEGLLAPLKVGQVFYLSSADGSKLATPFQPKLNPQTALQYQTPHVLPNDPRRFVIADGREKVYLVAVVDQPQPHLEQIAEANAGPYPIESPLVAIGDAAIAVAGSSHLVRFQLPALQPAGESNLPAPVVWGPYRVADTMLFATADGQLMSVSASGEITWKAPTEHGDLAGTPLTLPDSVLVSYRKGIVERRSLTDGKPLGTANLEHPLATGPVAFLQRIVVAANDGTLLVIDQP